MATIDSYNRTNGRFVDIRDVLFEIEGTDTKTQDVSRIIKAKNSLHKWVEQKYSTGTSNTAQKVEGAQIAGETALTTVENSNYTEINSVAYDITDRMNAIAKAGGLAGVKDQLKQSLKDAMIELKARVERSVINGVLASGDKTGGLPSKMQGLIPMASTLGTSAYSSDANFGTTGEATFRTFLQTVYNAGWGRTNGRMFSMSYATKDKVAAGFKGIVTQVQSAADKATIYMDVEVYKSQFGNVMVMAENAYADGKIVVSEKPYHTLAVLETTHPVDVARTGLSKIIAYANDLTQAYDKPSTLGMFFAS